MIALLVALSLATPASHGHQSAHAHRHKHAPGHANRCRRDAQRVLALELRIGGAPVPEAELKKLENQLERAIERARRDCGS
jgi:hypothetical protein